MPRKPLSSKRPQGAHKKKIVPPGHKSSISQTRIAELDFASRMVHFCWKAKDRGLTPAQTLEAANAEFSEHKFNINAIYGFLNKGREIAHEEVVQFANDHEMMANRRLNALMAKFLPIATAPVLYVRRTKVVDGQHVEVIDHDENQVQMDAAKVVLDVIKQQCRVNRIGILRDDTEDKNLPQQTVIQIVNNLYSQGQQGELVGGRLGLFAGDAEIDTEALTG